MGAWIPRTRAMARLRMTGEYPLPSQKMTGVTQKLIRCRLSIFSFDAKEKSSNPPHTRQTFDADLAAE